jgi:hypothetical protein
MLPLPLPLSVPAITSVTLKRVAGVFLNFEWVIMARAARQRWDAHDSGLFALRGGDRIRK